MTTPHAANSPAALFSHNTTHQLYVEAASHTTTADHPPKSQASKIEVNGYESTLANSRTSFTREVLWTLLKDVKFGETVSYKQLADMAGNSKAARAVGGAMRSNPNKRREKEKGVQLLKVDGRVITDGKEKAEVLSSYLILVFFHKEICNEEEVQAGTSSKVPSLPLFPT
ncbi:Methylated-DNA--protein-cysteine methyltransferase [Varanus komodoensis]|nr:Methylated-DNA--protein-cysteine methyltransferase [Varanus komodoensis]